MEPPLDLDDPSSDGQNDMRNHIHIEDYLNPIRDNKNEAMLREMEAERRMQEINGNNKMMFKELHKIHGESEMQNMQQQNVINELLTQIQTPYSIFSDNKPKPLFPSSDPALEQHLRSVEMSQQSRQAPAYSFSGNNPEPTHEPKGPVGRPRIDHHGVPTETRTYPLWWQSQPVGMIQTQLSNRGWRKPHFKHFTQKGAPAKRLTKEHYLNELFYLLGDLGDQ